MKNRDTPARFLWLPPGLRPPVPMVWRQEHVFLLVGVAARQAASPTAILSHQPDAGEAEAGLLAPGHGAFNQAVADDLKRWKEGSARQADE